MILGKFLFISVGTGLTTNYTLLKRLFVSELHALPWLVPNIKQPMHCLHLKTPGRDSTQCYAFMFVPSLFYEDPSLHTENEKQSHFKKRKAESDRNTSLLQSNKFISDSNPLPMIFYFCYFSSVTQSLTSFSTYKMSMSVSLTVH